MILTAGLVLTLSFALHAQSVSNVEKASRFRTSQTQVTVTVQTAAQISAHETPIASRTLHHKSAVQLQELGSRYAMAWAR